MTFGSLLEEARSRHPAAPDEALMAQISADIVADLGLDPPIDEEIVASYQGIRRIERSPLPWAGCLLCEAGELTVCVRSTDPLSRQRFTIFHEIAHTFLPGFRDAPQFRCTPMSARSRRDSTEALCDVAASELLLPARYVRGELAASSFDLSAVETLADTYGASLEATARRFVSLWPEPSVLVRMELMTKPADPHGQPKLRVSSTHVNGEWPYMPKFKSVADAHVLNMCLDGHHVTCSSDLDDLAVQPTGPVELNARPYPYIDSDGNHHQRVLVLARRHR